MMRVRKVGLLVPAVVTGTDNDVAVVVEDLAYLHVTGSPTNSLAKEAGSPQCPKSHADCR